MTETDTPVTADPRRWAVLAVMSFCMFIVVMDNTILVVALKSIQQSLSATNAQLQWAMDAYTLTYAALMFSAGVLGDRFGRRAVLVCGMLFFAVVSTAGAWSGDTSQLTLWRALMGVGAAVVPGCSMAVITTAFPVAERAKAIGLWSVANGVGIACGPVIGGALVGTFWWGSALLVNVPLTIAAVVAILLLVPNTKAPQRGRLDIAGVGLSITGVGLLVYGVISGGEPGGWLRAQVFGPIAASVVLLGVLGWHSARAANPALDLMLLRTKKFAAGAGTMSMTFFAVNGASFVLVFYVQILRGFSPLDSGLLMLPVAVGAALAGQRSDVLVARFGAAAVVAAGAIALCAGCIGFALLGQHAGMWVFGVLQFVCGLGFGATLAPSMTAALSVVPPARSGAGSALANTFRQLGTALGVAVLGSTLGTAYRDRLGAGIDALPEHARGEAGNSLGSTLLAVQQAQTGASGATPAELAEFSRRAPELVAVAQSSFLSAMQVTMMVSAVVAALAAVTAMLWLPSGKREQPLAEPDEASVAAPPGPS
ncbi:MFS transporter [Nocardia sp. SYP-A9097]|uniref:MFS transporter n=1 Tax=Nocardia sp. SYP-A9097 TaxID=2663237 RepID=UPI00129B843E|nr:MFS transporter [Nocardia sp. SYP-A9097]MRH88383.1 MFS transporter [Nocardia sp. SYP-A9097]